MDEFTITTAVRTASPVSVFIQGVSGSGKTYSALLLARGLAGPGEKIGIIDTEGGRSLIYADDPDIGGFQHMPFAAPFTPERFTKAVDAGVAAGWKAVIIDSASLEHDGEGGLLEMADEEEQAILKKNPNNRASSQQKWTKPKLRHKRFLNHICGLPIHVIGCFRETLTTDFDAKDERGMKKPTTVLTVVTEKNTLYSFELHVKIDADHRAHWSRIPKPYIGAIAQDAPITVQTGALLSSACNVGGKAAPKPEAKPDDAEKRLDCILDIESYLDSEGVDVADFNTALEAAYKGKYRDYAKLPTDHLAKLATSEKLEAMVKKARELKGGEG
jgi:hypothetical protein